MGLVATHEEAPSFRCRVRRRPTGRAPYRTEDNADGLDRYRRPMTAALAVTAAVALLAIVMLVVTARRAGTRLDAERARANRLEAQVRALEEAASASVGVSDAGPGGARGEPVFPAEDAKPAATIPLPADQVQPEPATPAAGAPSLPVPTEEPTPAAGAPSPAVPTDEPTPAGVGPSAPVPTEAPAASAPAETPLPAEEPTPAATSVPTEEPTPAAAPGATSVPTEESTPPASAPAAETPLPAEEPTPAGAVAPAASVPTEGAGTSSHGAVAAEPLWELERLRLEREWADIVGASTPLPVPWDRSVHSVVAVELDIIREVIGTPSRIEPATSSAVADPAAAVATARLATEILRRLAKAGEEIAVSFETDTDVTMAVAVVGDEVKPDLSDLTTTAAELGGRLTFVETEAGFEAQLQVPSPPS